MPESEISSRVLDETLTILKNAPKLEQSFVGATKMTNFQRMILILLKVIYGNLLMLSDDDSMDFIDFPKEHRDHVTNDGTKLLRQFEARPQKTVNLDDYRTLRNFIYEIRHIFATEH